MWSFTLPATSGLRPSALRRTSGHRTVSTIIPGRSGSFNSGFNGESLRESRRVIGGCDRLAAQVVARQGGGGRQGGRRGDDKEREFVERVVQVNRVSKTVKGGRNISFRAVVVVGNEKGVVGVGNASAKEVATAVQQASIDAKKNLVTVPLLKKTMSFPHELEYTFGAAKVMLKPASEGTGVIAGGAVRVVLECAGVRNAFGKQLGSASPMNNAKATLQALAAMKTFKQVSQERGVTVDFLMRKSTDPKKTADEQAEERAAAESEPVAA